MFSFLFKHNKRYSDYELVELYQSSHDPKFVGMLFQRYSHLIAAIALDFLNEKDAEDASMEIYEVLLSDLKKHDINKFDSWLYSVTRNYCLKKKRQMSKKQQVDLKESHMLHLDQQDLEEKREREEQINVLSSAVSQLNPEQKKCIELFFWDEKSYKEIVDITGIEMTKVKSHIQNGKRNLKKQIKV